MTIPGNRRRRRAVPSDSGPPSPPKQRLTEAAENVGAFTIANETPLRGRNPLPSAVETASAEGFVDFTATIEVQDRENPRLNEDEDLDAFGGVRRRGRFAPNDFASTVYADESDAR